VPHEPGEIIVCGSCLRLQPGNGLKIRISRQNVLAVPLIYAAGQGILRRLPILGGLRWNAGGQNQKT
jgi:hypothetical protein